MTLLPCFAAILAILLLPTTFARAQTDAAASAAVFEKDLAELTRHPSRSVGTAGYYAAADFLEKQIATLPNVELRRHEFPIMAPMTESATLDLGGGRVERIYPLWPAHVRVNATSAKGIKGNLVYAGEARYEQLKPASLRGQIAVVEASAGSRWMDAAYMGARAILVLGWPGTSWSDLQSHDLRIPVNLPRFYVPPGKLADELRAGAHKDATLTATVAWQQKLARNYYALVRPAKKQLDGWDFSQPPAALMFSVPFDASSFVPDLAPGASQAVQAAAGLALLRDLSKHPWDRPVVVTFTGGDAIQMLATRNMFSALAESPAIWRKEVATLDKRIADADRDLVRARAAAASPGTLKMPGDADLIGRILKIVDTDLALQLDKLFRARSVPLDQRSDEQKAALKTLEAQQVALNRLKYGLQQDPSSLSSDGLRRDADVYLARTIDRLGGGGEVGGPGGADGLVKQLAARKAELETRIALYHWLADATGRPREPAEKQTDARLIELLVGIDLSDRGTRVGPMHYGFFQRNSAMPLIQEFRDWFTRVQSDFPTIDFEPLRGGRLPPTYLAAPLPLASELAQAWGVPGVSMITLNDLRARRDTPTDTPDAIDRTKITPQLDAVINMFRRAAGDKRFVGPNDIRRLNVALTGQVVSTAPGRPLPDLPRPGFLATYSYHIQIPARIPQLGGIAPSLGVRRTEVEPCDAEGNYRFEGIPKLRADRLEGIEKLQADMQVVAVQMFRVDPKQGGAITATSDLAQQVGDMKWWVDLRQQDVRPIRSLVFDCEEFSLTRLYDPRFLQTLSELLPLDARQGAEPKRFNFLLAHQMLAGFVEPGMPTDLLIRYGRVGNRLVLLNMPDGGKGDARGYTPAQLNDLGPLALSTAKDFQRLDEARLAEYRRAGVSAKILDDLHATAASQVATADAALSADDGAGLIRNANGAWANEARVYHAAQAMARDVIRAAIFLLILCVPFSFCMERLLIATPNVYKQIAGMAVIFLLMTAALWSFHPAFKISASPLIIILAFAIILMSCVVIFVVYNKFDAELTRMRARASAGMITTTTGGDGDGAAAITKGGGAVASGGTGGAKASVLMSAILLGIANMRRRKFRTLLTSITIVLITFAVLCFTSTSTYVGSSATPTGIAASHGGVQLRQRGFRPIPEILPDQLRAVLADPALKLTSTPTVVERWWAVSTSEPNEQYNLSSAAKTISLPALLGLSPGESKLSKLADVIGAEKLARLEKGDANIIYLSDETAARLGNVKEGDTIRLAGLDLIVAAVFSAKQFDDQVRTLSGDSLAPLKYVSGQLDAGGRKLDDNAAESLDVGGDSSEAGAGYDFLPASDFAIVPKDICRRLYKSTLRSVALRLDDEAATKRVADELSKRFSLALFAGYGPADGNSGGVFMVSAGTLSNASGAGAVAVPLLVAGLIIFNTMMGSIAERKKEIHVYTSLGLAPAHVGAFFVAEALTYGLIGSVFGYVIGQGVGTLLLKLGWLGPVTLNYSGSSAMMTMLLILGIVLLSSLVPARLASKLASPSIDRQWKIPEPQAGVITTSLPFTINQTAADGVLAYLKEFFDDHREGAVGVFASGPVLVASEEAGGGQLAVGGGEAPPTAHRLPSTVHRPRMLTADTWLTPFDLGVRQRTEVHIEPGAFPEIFEVRVVLTRLSGDDKNFHRMNRPFLTALRQQFLRWRSLPPAAMQRYVNMSRT